MCQAVCAVIEDGKQLFHRRAAGCRATSIQQQQLSLLICAVLVQLLLYTRRNSPADVYGALGNSIKSNVLCVYNIFHVRYTERERDAATAGCMLASRRCEANVDITRRRRKKKPRRNVNKTSSFSYSELRWALNRLLS